MSLKLGRFEVQLPRLLEVGHDLLPLLLQGLQLAFQRLDHLAIGGGGGEEVGGLVVGGLDGNPIP